MYLNGLKVDGRHRHPAIAFLAVCRAREAVDFAVAFVPVAHHSRGYEALQEVRHCWRVLALLKQQLCGDPQNPVQIRRPFRAHGVAAR